jgi:hypothetical protein
MEDNLKIIIKINLNTSATTDQIFIKFTLRGPNQTSNLKFKHRGPNRNQKCLKVITVEYFSNH